MAYGDEIYSDESLEQRAKRVNELTERAAKVVRDALSRAQRAQDARDQLLEANANMLHALLYKTGAMHAGLLPVTKGAMSAIDSLRENTGRNLATGQRE